jgi:hypothetical protein
MAVLGVPSSESRWISLRATSSPVWRLRPLKTCPGQFSGQNMKRLSLAEDKKISTYRSVGSLTQLLQLLERTRVSLIHLVDINFGLEVVSNNYWRSAYGWR